MDKLINAIIKIRDLAEGTPELSEDFEEDEARACDDTLNNILSICRELLVNRNDAENDSHS